MILENRPRPVLPIMRRDFFYPPGQALLSIRHLLFSSAEPRRWRGSKGELPFPFFLVYFPVFSADSPRFDIMSIFILHGIKK